MGSLPLSVIMTVYNGERFLRKTLDAIFAQTFSDFELVVVNNSCTDGTQAILDSYEDSRLRIVHQTLAKPTFGDGIRLAYANARGEFIAVNDGDDVPFPERFERQVAALQADPKVALVSGFYTEIDEHSHYVRDCTPPCEVTGLIETYQSANPLAHSTYMYRKSVADQVGGYVEKYHYGSDFALAMALLKAGWKITVLPHNVMKIRIHSAQASQVAELSVMRAREAVELFGEAATLPGLSAQGRKLARKNGAKRLVQYGFALFEDAQRLLGMGKFIKAMFKSPLYGTGYFLFRLACYVGLMKHPVYNRHHP